MSGVAAPPLLRDSAVDPLHEVQRGHGLSHAPGASENHVVENELMRWIFSWEPKGDESPARVQLIKNWLQLCVLLTSVLSIGELTSSRFHHRVEIGDQTLRLPQILA